MPLPQKVAEQLGREPPKTPGWSGKLLMFSATIFFIAGGIYAGITFGYQAYLESQIAEIENRIKTAGQEVSDSDIEGIRSFYSQLTNVQTLLKEHVFPARLFEWLEAHTHTAVWFSNFGYSREQNEVALQGTVDTVEHFVQQITELERQPEVARVTSRTLRRGITGVWEFDLTIAFEKTFPLEPALGASGDMQDLEKPEDIDGATAPLEPQ